VVASREQGLVMSETGSVLVEVVGVAQPQGLPPLLLLRPWMLGAPVQLAAQGVRGGSSRCWSCGQCVWQRRGLASLQPPSRLVPAQPRLASMSPRITGVTWCHMAGVMRASSVANQGHVAICYSSAISSTSRQWVCLQRGATTARKASRKMPKKGPGGCFLHYLHSIWLFPTIAEQGLPQLVTSLQGAETSTAKDKQLLQQPPTCAG
jgi:hypothetical protein